MSVYRDAEPAAREAERARAAKRRLLGVVWPASPCASSWATMEGDERKRRCRRCARPIYDVAPMSSSEVIDLSTEVDEDAANSDVRFFRRADGRFLVGDCPDGRARQTRQKRRDRVIGAVILALALLGFQRMIGGDERESSSSYAADR